MSFSPSRIGAHGSAGHLPGALMVIRDGRIIEESLRRELMTRDDLIERLRAKGIDGVEGVRVAYIESDGDISALP